MTTLNLCSTDFHGRNNFSWLREKHWGKDGFTLLTQGRSKNKVFIMIWPWCQILKIQDLTYHAKYWICKIWPGMRNIENNSQIDLPLHTEKICVSELFWCVNCLKFNVGLCVKCLKLNIYPKVTFFFSLVQYMSFLLNTRFGLICQY